MKKIYSSDEIFKRRAAQTRAIRAKRSHGIKHDWQDIYDLIWSEDIIECFYCKSTINKQEKHSYELDHKVPILRGGSHEKENLCIACVRCNRTKCLMTSLEFLKCIDDLKAAGNWD